MPKKFYSVRVTFWAGPTKVYHHVTSHDFVNNQWLLTRQDETGIIASALSNVKTLEVI